MLRWLCVTVPKWTLVALGAYLVVGLAGIELAESRVGVGTGVTAALVLAIIKGAVLALQRSPQPPTASE